MRKAPQKTCPSCSKILHVKNARCSCGHEFYQVKNGGVVKISSKQHEDIEEEKRPKISWQTLLPGDIIKSVHGHGPYWLNGKNNEREYMGSYGKFTVRRVMTNGILVQSKYGTDFIYMGPKRVSNHMPSYINAPHRILKLTTKKAFLEN